MGTIRMIITCIYIYVFIFINVSMYTYIYYILYLCVIHFFACMIQYVYFHAHGLHIPITVVNTYIQGSNYSVSKLCCLDIVSSAIR